MFKGTPLNLPPHPFKLKKDKDKVYIFDELRKKYLLVTPEEWVRQHWIQNLIKKGYPKSLIQCEGAMKLNELRKRSDLVAYNTLGRKILLAEFKAPTVKISQTAFEQIARYNFIQKVPLLLVSNGLVHYYCKVDFDNEAYSFLEDLPDFDTIQIPGK